MLESPVGKPPPVRRKTCDVFMKSTIRNGLLSSFSFALALLSRGLIPPNILQTWLRADLRLLRPSRLHGPSCARPTSGTSSLSRPPRRGSCAHLRPPAVRGPRPLHHGSMSCTPSPSATTPSSPKAHHVGEKEEPFQVLWGPSQGLRVAYTKHMSCGKGVCRLQQINLLMVEKC